jgi:hypothetical protein
VEVTFNVQTVPAECGLRGIGGGGSQRDDFQAGPGIGDRGPGIGDRVNWQRVNWQRVGAGSKDRRVWEFGQDNLISGPRAKKSPHGGGLRWIG